MDIGRLGSVGASEYTRLTNQQQQQKEDVQAAQIAEGEATAPHRAQAPPQGPPPGKGGEQAAGQNGQPGGQNAAAAMQNAAATASAEAATTDAATTTDEDDDSAYEAIVQKADTGQTLTSSELSQLRAKDPARYSRALQAAQARASLRTQMEQDPSKANQMVKEAISAAQAAGQDGASIAGAHSGMAQGSALVDALNDEYASFAKRYDQVMFDTGVQRTDDDM